MLRQHFCGFLVASASENALNIGSAPTSQDLNILIPNLALRNLVTQCCGAALWLQHFLAAALVLYELQNWTDFI